MEISMDYTIIKSRRKTLSLTVDGDGNVIIKAPYGCPDKTIAEFAEKHSGWINEHRKKSEDIHRKYAFSGTFPLMGREIPIVYGSGFLFTGDKLEIPEGRDIGDISAQLEYIYRRAAQEYLPQRVKYFSRIMGVSPSQVKISGAEKRWGSCSGRKTINFAWRLAAASPELMDYVVVHELAHLSEMNHSPRFWAIVAAVLPDYREREKRLNEVGIRLRVILG